VRSIGGTGGSRSDWSVIRSERGPWKGSATVTTKSNAGHSLDDASIVHSEHGGWVGMSPLSEHPAVSPLGSPRKKGKLGGITTTNEVLVQSHVRPESEVSNSDSSVWMHST
jgi:hypothetical protein